MLFRKIARFVLLASLALLAGGAMAQDNDADEVSASFLKVSPEEAIKLRSQLLEPVPKGVPPAALAAHFQVKRQAANRLGDPDLTLALYRQWVAAVPEDTFAKNNLANELSRRGEYAEAIRLNKEALDKIKSEVGKEQTRINLAWKYFFSGRYEQTQKTLDQAVSNVKALRLKGVKTAELPTLSRVEGNAWALQSNLHSRFGRWAQAADAAVADAVATQLQLKLVQDLPDGDFKKSALYDAAFIFGDSLGKKVYALSSAGRFGEAEEALKEYMRLSKEWELPPNRMAGIYQAAGSLRLKQREFVAAEDYYRRAQRVKAKLGYGELDQVDYPSLIETLEGQHRWVDALAELTRLDALAGTDEVLKRRVKFSYERGYAYLASGQRLLEAVGLFQDLANVVEKRYPPNHFFVAQAKGLKAVALWRLGDAQSREKALPLLQAAVRDYMLPDNMDMETMNVRKDVRQLIFSTYLEAMFVATGAQPMEAMAPADWVRGGMVQEALADAALRSAVSDPVLSGLVRADQNQKNEIEALRKFLAGDAGGSRTTLPEVAATMRARIADLETSRRALHEELKAKFPDYERLVRPAPPTVADIRKELAPDEALVMVLPTDDAVYVWALTSNGKDTAVRVPVEKGSVEKMVRDMRATLDFAEMGNGVRPFNATAASDLYERLLAPVAASIAGKQHLVIAAGGVLGQVPFGVLLTQPTTQVSPSSPWLIKQAAITHIPSLSAWLSVKQFGKSKSAAEPMAAWGDPQFSASKQLASATRGLSSSTRQVVLTRSSSVVDLEKEDVRGAIRYGDIPSLPETRDELLAIAKILNANPKRDLHLGVQASKASVLKSSLDGELLKKRVIAFATHGLMAGDLPNLTQPALALASTGDEKRDPLGALLTLDEVLGLKLNADWVILSACNTAAADGKADEALSGLARGFFYAGSRSLLVTHWAVESSSAKELTTATMKNYVANPTQKKAESLRQAMLAVMAKPQYQHPAFWAPYALVGDGGR